MTGVKQINIEFKMSLLNQIDGVVPGSALTGEGTMQWTRFDRIQNRISKFCHIKTVDFLNFQCIFY
jgi:hypothetical protein